MRRVLIFWATCALVLVAVAPAAMAQPAPPGEIARVAFTNDGSGSNTANADAGALLAPCTDEEYQRDDCPWWPFEEHGLLFVFDESDQGSTVWMDSNSAGWNHTVERLTDGLAGYVVPWALVVPGGGGGSTKAEAAFFGSQAGPNGIDLAGYELTRIGFEVTSVTVDSPGRDPNGDGAWTDIEYSGWFVFEGYSTIRGTCPRGGGNVPHPEGGGWSLEPIEATVDADVGNIRDQNGDGYVCQRFVIGLSKKHGFGVWVVKDNSGR